MSTEVTKYKLPTFKELCKDKHEADKQDELNMLLSNVPPQAWIKQNKFVSIEINGQKQPLQYITVEKVKFLLTKIFQVWHTEILETKQVFNSVCVTLRLKVRNPITGEWICHDGVGAVGVQVEAGNNASDMSKIKHDAVMKAAPAAASYALKNAAEKLGAIFGANLQKTDIEVFNPSYNAELKEEIAKQAKARFNGTATDNK